MSFHSSTTRVARKDHKCSLCGTAIKKGDKYIDFAGKYYDFYSGKHHEKCEDLIIKYCEVNQEKEYTYDVVLDWIYDENCRNCDKGDDCDVNPFRCEIVLKNTL